jgi:two-component system phosphate regulon sensor histidine kinase PhoR
VLVISALATAGIVLATGLVLIGRAATADAEVVELRAQFVSTVTHELKTPIAAIRALGETLVSGRITSRDSSLEYARLIVQEAKSLTRLVDNLLAYARVTDVAQVYSFEPLGVRELVEGPLREFSTQLAVTDFSVNVDIEPELLAIRADRVAIRLVLANLIDNAIRYSRDTRWLRIRGRPAGDAVVIEVSDKGTGIPESDIPHVTRRFFRGRGAVSGGSGLGLSISDRIVADHGGSLTISSTVGVGTTVTLCFPMADLA